MDKAQDLVSRCVAFNIQAKAIDDEAQRKKDILKAFTGDIFSQRDTALLAEYQEKPDSFHVGDRVRMKESAFSLNWGPGVNVQEKYGDKVFTLTGFSVMAPFQFGSTVADYWIVPRAIDDHYIPDPSSSSEYNEWQRNNLGLPGVEYFEKVA